MSNEVDAATLAVCEDSHRLAHWSYILDTSEDENYPVVSTGELILRADGVAFQRIHLCDEAGFGPWHRALRGDPPLTVDDVERLYGSSGSSYSIARMTDRMEQYRLGRRVEERAVLTASLCRELQKEDAAGNLATNRSAAAYRVLVDWMYRAYEIPAGTGVDFRHGLEARELLDVPTDIRRELSLGAKVCEDLLMAYCADTSRELEGDLAYLRKSLAKYLSHTEKATCTR